jgi:hypothetical protein
MFSVKVNRTWAYLDEIRECMVDECVLEAGRVAAGDGRTLEVWALPGHAPWLSLSCRSTIRPRTLRPICPLSISRKGRMGWNRHHATLHA